MDELRPVLGESVRRPRSLSRSLPALPSLLGIGFPRARSVLRGNGREVRSSGGVQSLSHGALRLCVVTGLGAGQRAQERMYGPCHKGTVSAHTTLALHRSRPKSLASLGSPGLGRRQGGSR